MWVKCVLNFTLLLPLQRDLESEGSLCPSLQAGQVFAMGAGKGLLGFGDGMSYRYIFRSLWKASVYRLHVHLAAAPGSGVSERGRGQGGGEGGVRWEVSSRRVK